jgi:hypothetical protein
MSMPMPRQQALDRILQELGRELVGCRGELQGMLHGADGPDAFQRFFGSLCFAMGWPTLPDFTAPIDKKTRKQAQTRRGDIEHQAKRMMYRCTVHPVVPEHVPVPAPPPDPYADPDDWDSDDERRCG